MFNYGNCGTGYSLADIAAATGNDRNGNDGMWNDGGAWWIIILFLFVFCGWGGNGFGGGFGNNGASGALTRGELCQDMNFSDLEAGVRGVQQGLCDGFYAMNTGMLNGFAGVQQSLANGFSGVDNAICTLGYQTQAGINSVNVAGMQNTNAIQQSINDVNVGNMVNTNALQGAIKDNTFAGIQNTNAIQTQLAECCCENRAAIADVKYTMATDTCAINNAIANSTRDMIDNQNANTRSILDFLVQDKISSLENENAGLRLAASQEKQNNYLVNALRPCPIPAYQVANPFCCQPNYGCGC